jgi:NADH-quinone oxidoreductase subunit D
VTSSYERAFDIPIGPQHPALKEPALLKIKVEGEYVVSVSVDVSYNHRGIEKAAEYRSYVQNLYLVERICGICNVAHTLSYCLCVEQAHGREAPARAVYLRIILQELARIQSHLIWVGVGGHEMGFDTLFMYSWLDREIILDLIEAISGNRITSSFNIIGGVRRDISPDVILKIRKGMDRLEERVKYYTKIVQTDRSIIARTKDVGILTPSEVVSCSAVGPTARASGIKVDVRVDDPYSGYDLIPFNVMTDKGCDSFARIIVRMDEMVESINVIRYCLDHLPTGALITRLPRKVPAGDIFVRIEAPRGELCHYLRSDGSEKPNRYKVRTPTFANLPALVQMLTSHGGRAVNIADVPVILASIDPCFACTARFEKVGVKGGESP